MKQLIFFLTLILVLVSCEKASETDTGNLEGNIYSSDNMPISGAQVSLPPYGFISTDESGYFLFSNIPSGEYTLSVSYQSQIVYSKEITINAGNTKSIDIIIQSSADAGDGNNISGEWILTTRSDFSNSLFTGSLSVNLYIVQTSELMEGYSQDVYKITGTFSDLSWIIQRKSDPDMGYPFQNGSGNIIDGGININSPSHLLEFYLSSSSFHFKGVSPSYEEMWGDIIFKIDMTSVYGTDDGIITLNGSWDAERK